VVERAARILVPVLGAYVALFALAAALPGDPLALPLFAKPAVAAVQVAAALLVLARGLTLRGGERIAWLALGAGALGWASADVFWIAVLLDQESVPVPSAADAGYLLLIPCALLGLVGLARRRTAGVGRALLLDGATAALAAAALSAALVLEAVLDDLAGDTAAVATNLAYVVGDVALLGVAVGVVAVRGWRLDRTWTAVLTALLCFWVADSHYLVSVASPDYAWPNLPEAGWPASLVLLAYAAWTPRLEREPPAAGLRAVLLPLAFAGSGLAILFVAALSSLNALAVVLAGGSLLAVFGRLALALRENRRMLERSESEARTDALTGLGNRRALTQALDRALERGTPAALALFDLDGFKSYNDTFGHPAGDALLQRLAEKLATVLPREARAFRMGGDEFCVLAPPGRLSADELGRLCALALTEEGNGFRIGCSFGAVALPGEAGHAAQALRLADERLYAHKASGRASAGTQSSAVLLTALAARDPDLGAHLDGTGDLAADVAARLGLSAPEVDEVRRAAELHDVGKVAIPDAILVKPGPLDDHEWAFMRRHTIVGERILAAAPALRRVAAYVRSSHERWDGLGYPDGLAGEAIPLGARIVCACDAYDAMRTDRPYRASVSEAEALAELRRCAGTQFDPAVVEALEAALHARRAGAPVH
jgi:two-component system, cell cycle response regulator